MLGVIINEKEVKENADKGIFRDNVLETLGILAKDWCFKHSEMEDEDIPEGESLYDSLKGSMEKYYPDFKEDDWKRTLNKTTKIYGGKNRKLYKIIDIKEIPITNYEWDKIIALNDRVLERVYFIMLVYSKIADIRRIKKEDNGWINQNISDIFKEAKITYTGKKQYLALHEIYKARYNDEVYFEMPNLITSNSMKIISKEQESENKIIIENFNNVISYYYEIREKKKYKQCTECGIRFENKSKTFSGTRCTKCKKNIENKQAAIRMRRQYETLR